MVEILKYGGIALIIIGALALFIYAVKGGKALKSLLLNALCGAAVLILINVTARFTGVHIPVNPWTAAGALGFGVPAVCGMLLLPILFR